LPNWLMAIISVVSSKRLVLAILPILEEVFMLMTPLPPPD
jgi:membrane-associated HD superfamily phosphohydrolase